jgi:molybdopterin-guanine dinucleotide biosynthesis protein A
MPVAHGNAHVTGVLIAGGRSARMGGREKAMLEIGGKPLLQHVLARLRPQVGRIIINANGEPSRFHGYCLPVVADTLGDHEGPLAGLFAALQWSQRETPEARFVATVSADTPFIPPDLIERLEAGLREKGARSAIASSQGERHPVIGLWDLALAADVERALHQGMRAMHRFAGAEASAVVDFPLLKAGEALVDPFFNVNTPADLETARALLASLESARA